MTLEQLSVSIKELFSEDKDYLALIDVLDSAANHNSNFQVDSYYNL